MGLVFHVINRDENIFNVRIVLKGDKYGLCNRLTHDQNEPLIEFYDTDYMFDQYGQFISRYYLSTILKGKDGINLQGGVPKWYIDPEAMNSLRSRLKEMPWLIEDSLVNSQS